MKVYITEGSPMPIERQFRGKDYKWGDCEFIFSGEEEYDYLVTINGLPHPIESKVDKDHRFLFLGETPFIQPYNRKFVTQYGHAYGCGRGLIKKGIIQRCFPVLPWMIGCTLKPGSHECAPGAVMNYVDFASQPISQDGRKDKACLITSRKVMTVGHRRRVAFADYVLEHYPDLIDVYGNGYQSIPDKYDVLSQYKYSIIIENASYPSYWTEKIGDCFLAGCFPFYYGCKDIADFFKPESMEVIDIKKVDQTIRTLCKRIQEDNFSKSIPALYEARRRVLDDYNMFSMIDKKIKEVSAPEQNKQGSFKEVLMPLSFSFWDKINYRLAKKFESIY